jgi:uncharacterized membrane protein required for colicin V production
MLVMGLFRGRKRGMSLEVFTMLLWLAIVLVSSAAYTPAGNWLSGQAHIGALASYMICYVVIAGLVAFMFTLLRRVTSKVAGTDTFGRGEYYLGMPAGMIRFACMLLAVLALINARLYSYKEIKDEDAYLKDMYGSEYFPRLSTIQQDIFERSLIGPQIKKYLSFLLIKPTFPEKKPATSTLDMAPLP